jgi:hypothetical protein
MHSNSCTNSEKIVVEKIEKKAEAIFFYCCTVASAVGSDIFE